MTTETVLTDEQREDLYLAYLEPDMPGDEGDAAIKAIEQAVLQSPEVQRLREDAGRYRVLRDEEYQMLEDDPCVTDDSFNTFFGEDLDVSVDALKFRRDAAMKEQP